VSNAPPPGRARGPRRPGGPPRRAGAPPVSPEVQRASLAERRERRWRRRKIHAIGLIKKALAEHAPPALAVSVRLAIAFGTAHTHAAAGYAYDPELPRLLPGIDLAHERRRMLRCTPAPGPTGLQDAETGEAAPSPHASPTDLAVTPDDPPEPSSSDPAGAAEPGAD